MPESMRPYAKFWAALVGGAASSVAVMWADTVAGKIAVVVLSALTAASVYKVDNTSGDTK